MTLYSVAIALHVLVAVLAVGLVGAIPVTARLAEGPSAESLLRRLLRAVQAGLGAMVITGVLLDVAASGAFHRTTWFKASILLLVVLGFSLGRARAALRRGALATIERWGWVMCASVGLITLLMQTKVLP